MYQKASWHHFLPSPAGGEGKGRTRTSHLGDRVCFASLGEGASERHCVWPPLTVVMLCREKLSFHPSQWLAFWKVVIKADLLEGGMTFIWTEGIFLLILFGE